MKRIIVFLLLNFVLTFLFAEKIEFSIAIPEGNFFEFHKDQTKINNAGFLGICVEVRYEFLNDNYLCLKIGSVINYFLPIIGTFDRIGSNYTSEESHNVFFDLSYQYEFEKVLALGVGLCYSYDKFNYSTFEEYKKNEEKSYDIVSEGLGISGKIRSAFNENFVLSLQYLPVLINFDPMHDYSHNIFFDIGLGLGFEYK
jgi:hypothetical protein